MKSGNKKKANTYLEILTDKLKAQNVQERVGKLTAIVADGNLSDEGQDAYEKLGKTITQCMIASGNNSREARK